MIWGRRGVDLTSCLNLALVEFFNRGYDLPPPSPRPSLCIPLINFSFSVSCLDSFDYHKILGLDIHQVERISTLYSSSQNILFNLSPSIESAYQVPQNCLCDLDWNFM